MNAFTRSFHVYSVSIAWVYATTRGNTESMTEGVVPITCLPNKIGTHAPQCTGGTKSGAEESIEGIMVGISRYWQCIRLLADFAWGFEDLPRIYHDTITSHVLLYARRVIKGGAAKGTARTYRKDEDALCVTTQYHSQPSKSKVWYAHSHDQRVFQLLNSSEECWSHPHRFISTLRNKSHWVSQVLFTKSYLRNIIVMPMIAHSLYHYTDTRVKNISQRAAEMSSSHVLFGVLALAPEFYSHIIQVQVVKPEERTESSLRCKDIVPNSTFQGKICHLKRHG